MIKPLYLAIGVFDGVHCGHRYLVGEAIKTAHVREAWAGALTFHPHPKRVLQLPNAPELIYPIQQRYWILRKLGCDYVFVKKFTDTWSQSSPEKFFAYLRRLFPNLSGLYVGEDFHFGHNREGDVAILEDFCKRSGTIQLHVFRHLQYAGERICSTRVRDALYDGNLELVNHLLGQNYHYIGYVDDHLRFCHHSELKIKDGLYHCILKNKLYQQALEVSVENAAIQFQAPIADALLNKACILEFIKKLSA